MTALVTRPVLRSRAVFWTALGGYLAAAFVLVLGFDSIMEDALSRLSAASSVWSAVDPKLAAVGFVWTPLPALLMVPFTPLRVLWPELVSTGLLAAMLSAVAMAASVAVVHGIALDLRLRPVARWLLTGLFALQPMILIYSSNGMTEALLIACLLLAVRRLLRWLAEPDPRDLVVAGVALGIGYLARYEAVVAAAAATALVGLVTWRRTRDRAATRADVLLAGLPACVAFVLWALLSWVTVGSPFEQFTSHYGNAALVGGQDSGGLAEVGLQLAWLAPALLPVLLATRDRRAWAPLSVLGSVLVLEWMLRGSGNLFGFLRYQIMVIPLVVVLLALLARRARFGALLITVVLGVSAVSSGNLVTTNLELASQEYLRAGSGEANGMWAGDRRLAAEIDALDLPPGTVLADSGSAFAILAAAHHPESYLITSDAGFDAALADPRAHGIRYILRNEHGGIDRVRETWPALDGIAVLVDAEPGATAWSYGWTLWEVR